MRNINSSSQRGSTVSLHSIYVPTVKEGEDFSSTEEVVVPTGSEPVVCGDLASEGESLFSWIFSPWYSMGSTQPIPENRQASLPRKRGGLGLL